MLHQPVMKLFSLPARYTPVRCQALLMEPLLQRVLGPAIEDGELDFLKGDAVEICISDLSLHWFLTVKEDRIRFLDQAHASVTIRGGFREFLLLASRREDPDTLFFERRLCVEGDTEMGLLVKNLLDTIELDELPAPLRQAMSLGGSWVQ